MGNCGLRGGGKQECDEKMVKVVTHSGGVMELYPPITVDCITNGFPGHSIFKSATNLLSSPLLHNEELVGGQVYHLRPLHNQARNYCSLPSVVAPYRMSFDHHGYFWKRQNIELFPRSNSGGGGGGGNKGGRNSTWKVKLVISPAQLTEILSQDSRTEELIESVRTVAKCRNGSVSSVNSDQWSLASSRKASSELL